MYIFIYICIDIYSREIYFDQCLTWVVENFLMALYSGIYTFLAKHGHCRALQSVPASHRQYITTRGDCANTHL